MPEKNKDMKKIRGRAFGEVRWCGSTKPQPSGEDEANQSQSLRTHYPPIMSLTLKGLFRRIHLAIALTPNARFSPVCHRRGIKLWQPR
jgi:hypothetical protein